MILLVGQVARNSMEREAFQEVDYRRLFGHMVKWVAQIDNTERIPEFISRAFHVATAGRPGPVVLALPEDMLSEITTAADAAPYRTPQAHPGTDDMAQLRDLLSSAKRPFVIVGGGGWTSKAVADFQAFAEANGLPVGAAFRRQDRFDNTHQNYAGDVGIGINPKLAARIEESDVLLVVGARLGEMTTGGYELIGIPRPDQTLVHVHPDPEELGRVYQAALPVTASMAAFAAAARAIEAGFGAEPLYIREGGSIPVVNTFAELLKVDTLLLGWGQDDDAAHSPNEKFSLADFHRGALASARLWAEIANIKH